MTAAPRTTNGHALKHPPIVEGAIVILPFSQIEHDPDNYRMDWDSPSAVADLHDLAEKILVNGFMTRFAPAVYQLGPNRYCVKDGNRRLEAQLLLYRGGKAVPRGPGQEPYPLGYGPFTIIQGSEQDIRIEGLLSNIRRELNPLEEALAYKDVLLNGVPFLVDGEKIYATLTQDELDLVVSMATVLPTEIEGQLSVKTTFQSPFIKKLTVYMVVRQAMKSVSKITRIESLIKRLVLLNLIPEIQKLVIKGQLTIDFGEALAPLDRNHQYMAFEKWGVSSGKMDLRTWQSLCLALAEDQRLGGQATFDDSFWTIAAYDSIEDPKRKRKGRKYGLKTNKRMMAALDAIDLTRGLPNTDTALAILSTTLEQQGLGDLSEMLNAVREKLLSDYFTNPADAGVVLAYTSKGRK
jgi:hypothetical protein